MRKGLGLAALVVAGMLGMGGAQAAPVAVDSGLTAAAPAEAMVEKAQYYARPAYGYRRHYGHRHFGHRHWGHRHWGYGHRRHFGPRHFGHRHFYRY